MHSFTIKDRDIQVADIMKKIEENVRERKKAGFYSDDDIYTISTAEVDISHKPLKDDKSAEDEHTRYSREVETHREYLNQNWDSILKVSIISHRKIVGPFIVFFKKAVAFLLRPLIMPILESHVQFNSELVRLLNLLSLKSRQLDLRLRELDFKLEKFKKEGGLKIEALGEGQEYLNRFCQGLDLKVDELEDRLKTTQSGR